MKAMIDKLLNLPDPSEVEESLKQVIVEDTPLNIMLYMGLSENSKTANRILNLAQIYKSSIDLLNTSEGEAWLSKHLGNFVIYLKSLTEVEGETEEKVEEEKS